MDVIAISGVDELEKRISQASADVEAIKAKASALKAKNIKSIQSGTCKFNKTVTVTLPTSVDVSKSVVLAFNHVMNLKGKYGTYSTQVRGGGSLKDSTTLVLSYSDSYSGSMSSESYSALVSWQVIEFDY